MHRTVMRISLALALSAVAGGATAQAFVFGWNPRSGDVWVDTQLADVNQYGMRYRDPFIDELTRYYGAPRDLVSELLGPRRWAPGDVYFACALAQAAGMPCRRVVDEWDRSHGEGWGVVAQRLGIKPGSAEFHRLKRGFVPTYDHWGRPIELDDSLHIDFPDRGKGPKGTAAFDHPGHGEGHDKAGHDGGHGKPAGDPGQAKPEHGGHGHSGKEEHGKDAHGKGKDAKGHGNGSGKGHGH
jgi:hypothetical protein